MIISTSFIAMIIPKFEKWVFTLSWLHEMCPKSAGKMTNIANPDRFPLGKEKPSFHQTNTLLLRIKSELTNRHLFLMLQCMQYPWYLNYFKKQLCTCLLKIYYIYLWGMLKQQIWVLAEECWKILEVPLWPSFLWSLLFLSPVLSLQACWIF